MVLVVALAGAGACRSVAPPGTIQTSKGPVAAVAASGAILNGVTSKPVAGATISLEGAGETTSTDDGRFSFPRAPVGRRLLRVSGPGFRDHYENVNVVPPEKIDPDNPTLQNTFLVPIVSPSPYWEAYPPAAGAKPCKDESECPQGRVCLATTFREVDMPACVAPIRCTASKDCKQGQECAALVLLTGQELRVCQGQPTPEALAPSEGTAP